MVSTSETGHSTNVANFEELISRCTALGPAFNPSKDLLKIVGLNTKNTSAKNALQSVKTAKTAFDNATNSREIAFESIKKLSTRILNALEVSGATKQTVADAVTINRKIQGQRANTKDAAATENPDAAITGSAPKQISVSQQSYNSLVDHFAKLILLITAEPLYTPNENDLKLTALNTAMTSLKTANTAVINAETAYKNAIINRNKILYDENTGLVPIAFDVKKYVKSLFGSTSPEYKLINSIRFRSYKK